MSASASTRALAVAMVSLLVVSGLTTMAGGIVGTNGAANVAVDQPVGVAQSVSDTTVAPGQTITVEATVDGERVDGPAIDATIPEGWTFAPVDNGSGTLNVDERQWIWLTSASHTVTYEVTVPADAAGGSYTIAAEGSGISSTTGERVTDTAETTVRVEGTNEAPTADAGSDRSVEAGVDVALDGDGSTDPDGDSLSYAWSQTGGPDASLSGADTATPSFTAPDVQQTRTLTFELTVSDGDGGTDTDTVSVTVSPAEPTNRAPTASAGSDLTVTEGASVELDGNGSSDPDGDSLTYAWSQTGGPDASLSGADTATPSVTPPDVQQTQTFTFELTVSDGNGASDTDTVSVTVEPAQQPNEEPAADAGSDLTVTEGASVELDGSDSADPDGDSLTYDWNRASGPTVSLSEANTATPTFTAPSVDASRTLTFELTVSDGEGGSNTDTVSVTVVPEEPPEPANEAPSADAGDDRTVVESASVELDGTDSVDPDDDSLSYDWTQTGGPDASLSDANTATPSVTPPDVERQRTLTFELVVEDGNGATDEDSVTVTVTPSDSGPDSPDSDPDSPDSDPDSPDSDPESPDSGPTEIDGCTVITDPGTYVLTDDVENSQADACIVVKANDVVVDGDGHAVDGVGDDGTTGVLVRGASELEDVVVRDLTATDWGVGVAYKRVWDGRIGGVTATGNDRGVVLRRSYEVVVAGTEASGNELDGVALFNADRNVVRDVVARDNGANGILLYGTGSNRNVLRDNTVVGNGENGIAVRDSRLNVLRGNAANDNGKHGILLTTAHGSVVVDDAVKRNGGYGLLVKDTDNLTLRNVHAAKNGDGGVHRVDPDGGTDDGGSDGKNGGTSDADGSDGKDGGTDGKDGAGEKSGTGPSSTFAVTDLSANASTVAVGEPVAFVATVANDGDASGTKTVTFAFGDGTVTRTVTVPAGETATVSVVRAFSSPGEHAVSVGGENATLVVQETTTTATSTPGTTRTGTPGFGVLAVLLGIALAALLATRRRT